MPRKAAPPSTEFPYHIGVRCINREWFHIPLADIWSLMEDYLFFISHAYEIEILSFVLMNNHFHLMVRSPKGNLSEAMNYFMRETSKRIGTMSARINQIYGDRFHRTLIKDSQYYLHVYKYIYRKPLEAGLCQAVQEYSFSTLHRKLGYGPLNFPVAHDGTLFSSYESTLGWLNQAPAPEDTELIRRALKKPVFELKTDRKTGRRPLLTERMY